MGQMIAVGLGGVVGAVSRFAINGWVQRVAQDKLGRPIPAAGTFAVNMLGCLLIGLIMAFVIDRKIPENFRLFLVTGCLGSLTTFSTFGYDTFELLRDSNLRMAAFNVIGSVAIGLIAVWLGFAAGRTLIS